MSAQFEHESQSNNRERGVALYFEDDKVALNTWEGPISSPRKFVTHTYHEVMLDRDAVRLLLASLTTMQADIEERFPKETQS